MRGILLAGVALLAGCNQSSETPVNGHDALVAHVEKNPVGTDPDQWIEMKTISGEWDRVGLIFGYYGADYDECLKAIAGLKKVNYAREYRCVPANKGVGEP